MSDAEDRAPIPERINMTKYKNFIVKKEKGSYRRPLSKTDEESFQSELVLMLKQEEELETRMKAANKAMKAEIAKVVMKRQRAKNALDVRYEDVEGTRNTIIFAEERRVGIYDDDGRLITHRPMSDTERQMDLMVETSVMEARKLSGAQAHKVTIESVDDLDHQPARKVGKFNDAKEAVIDDQPAKVMNDDDEDDDEDIVGIHESEDDPFG